MGNLGAEDYVDVLILNKDYGEFLDKSLSSVFNQTYDKINIIIVDDNSVDNSIEIIEQYKEKLKLIKLVENEPSISKVRNKLLDNITSKYCMFLSSDDYYHPEFIEKQINILKETNDEIGGVYSNFYWVDVNGAILSEVNNGNFENKESLNAVCSNPSCIITFESTLFKSSVFENLRFDLDIKHGEETFMGFVLTKNHHFIHNNDFLAYKTKHGKQGHNEYLKEIQLNVSILRNKINEFNQKK